MSILKADINKPVTITITDVAQVDGKFGKQVVLHAGDDSFYMAPASYDRQMESLGVDDPIGLRLEFSKVDIGGGKTAINIKQVSGTPTPAPKSYAPVTVMPVNTKPFPQPVPPSEDEGMLPEDALMLAKHRFVVKHIAPLYHALPQSMDALAACAHTLFLSVNRR